VSAGAHLVFVGGVHRSGTTLIARVLAAHPLVSGFTGTGVPEDEGQHLQSVLPTGLGFRTFPRRRWTPLRIALGTLSGPGGFGLYRHGHLTETSPLATAGNAATLREQWGRHWDTSRPFLVEKSPPNLLRTRLLRRLFPDCSFIIMVRHPIPVAYSTNFLHSVPRPLGRSLRHWVRCHELFVEDAGRLDRVLVVRYELLLREPEEVLAGVSRFLGLGGPPLAMKLAEGTNDAHFRRFSRLASGPLSGVYARALVRRYEAPVRRFGYSLRDLDIVDASTALDIGGPAAVRPTLTA
jgi:hypothetical protein